MTDSKNPVPHGKPLLCKTCADSVRLEASVRQFLNDWNLHKLGRINPRFVEESVKRIKTVLEQIDKENDR